LVIDRRNHIAARWPTAVNLKRATEYELAGIPIISEATAKRVVAAMQLDLELLDHIIIGQGRYTSLVVNCIYDRSCLVYTLQRSELEHAHDILSKLLELVLKHITTIFTLSKLEGDAIFAYTPDEKLARGETLFELIEQSQKINTGI
jgi:hypothetical protein